MVVFVFVMVWCWARLEGGTWMVGDICGDMGGGNLRGLDVFPVHAKTWRTGDRGAHVLDLECVYIHT